MILKLIAIQFEQGSKPKTPETSTPPWKQEQSAATTITSTLERRLTSSQSAPVSGFNSIQNSSHQTQSARLPRAQNPTITLLQKARGKYSEGFVKS